jgi:predicted phage terminase large subunit-like protein
MLDSLKYLDNLERQIDKWLPEQSRQQQNELRAKVGTLPNPQSGPQTKFFETTADIAIYGGAAYCGKTFALLLDFARFANDPQYRAVIFRRTSPQITNEGGLFDTAGDIYPPVGAIPKITTHEYEFPSGATIRFAHLQHEKTKFDWQGAQLDRLGYDELSHFTESQFFYLLSRVRSPHGVATKIRAGTNPDAESWVARFIEWWIGEDGYPDRDKAGVLRYFVRIDGEIKWGDSWQALAQQYPDLVATVGDYSTKLLQPLSVTFVPGTLFDNIIGVTADPTYLGKLQSLHPVERDRLLGGNWKVRYMQGLVFSRQWFNVLPPELAPTSGLECRFWDIAATAKELATSNHYYTAGTKMNRTGDRYTILHSVWDQVGPSEVENLIVSTAKIDGKRCIVRFELEGGANAVIFANSLVQKLRQLGFNAEFKAPRGDKVARALPFATAAHNNEVDLLQGLWNETYLDCALKFDGTPKPLVNDVIDSSSGCFNELKGRSQSPPPPQPTQRNLKFSRVF